MSRKRPRRTYPAIDSADEVVDWFVKHKGEGEVVTWSHQKFVFVKATSRYTGKNLQLGYMAQESFMPLIEVMFIGSPIRRFIVDDFYFDNRAPADVKQKFRAEAGPKGLILRGYAFIWFALEVAAKLNSLVSKKKWEAEVQPLLDKIEIVDSWKSQPSFADSDVKKSGAERSKFTRRDEHLTTKLSSRTLQDDKAIARLYAAAFEGHAKVSTEELATYLHSSGIYWPFVNKDAVEKHGHNVGSAAAFIDYTSSNVCKQYVYPM